MSFQDGEPATLRLTPHSLSFSPKVFSCANPCSCDLIISLLRPLFSERLCRDNGKQNGSYYNGIRVWI